MFDRSGLSRRSKSYCVLRITYWVRASVNASLRPIRNTQYAIRNTTDQPAFEEKRVNQTEAGTVEAAQKIPPGGRKSESHLQEGNAGRAPWFVRAFKLVVRAIFRLFFRVKVTGLKNVPSTPVIVCANHLGWTDTFLVLLF